MRTQPTTPEPPAASEPTHARRRGDAALDRAAAERSLGERETVAVGLLRSHFIAQEEAAGEVSEVEIAQLDPFLRGLLFTDGTVSRALEAHTLARVAVEAVSQEPSPLPAALARHLDVEPGEECLRRRVVMRIGGTRPAVWAESQFVTQRLPAEFLTRLDGDSQGIGGSLQQLKLESRRELLWFGLGTRPDWAPGAAPAPSTLTRLYRVIAHGAPLMLIREAFAVERRLGLYRLTEAGDAHARGPARVRRRAQDGEAADTAGGGRAEPA